MSWWKRHFGLDGIDLTIQAVLTGVALGIANSAFSGSIAEILSWKFVGISVVILAVRRHRNLLRLRAEEFAGMTSGPVAAERLADLESRMAALEQSEARVAELEERLDFAERMLARSDERAALPKGDHHG